MSSATEVSAGMKPLMPFWQRLLGSILFVGGVGGFSVLAYSAWSVIVSFLLLVGIAAIVMVYLQNKAITVRLTFGTDSVLIKYPIHRGFGKLIPVRVERLDDRRIFVERIGSIWEVKRFELDFASADDRAKAVAELRQYQRS